ncbi:V-type proton ATPase subunit H-like [Histomonas meleagridis]|uniref:V-type proton ATPase subunit H-like n=1 Tax=Histomonas meleagridis TaxID=135588 RepID=UPI00355A33B4|nr:V-type proton ATPase subunit H-like [Histomonas meleagridis]KAH0804930.1 V-type proton ATPase subunit H-like [Histomonas meleagridis]
MILKGSSKHPFFVRIEQRENILRQTPPHSLMLDTDQETDVSSFVDLFKQPIEEQLEAFCFKGTKHVATFAKLLETRNLPNTISLLCAFIDCLLDADFNLTVKSLLTQVDSLIKSLSNILISHSSSHDAHPFMIRTVLLLLGTLLSEPKVKCSEEHKSIFLRTVISLLGDGLQPASLAFEGLKRFLRFDRFRDDFIDSKGIELLLDLLGSAAKLAHTDSLYHILFCFWALTYSANGAGQLSENKFVKELSRLLSTIQPEREEIVRLLVNIIAQLTPSTVFVESAYDNDILRLLRQFQTKHYVDQEMITLISTTAEKLSQNLRKLSLWEKYTREVGSGKLHFSFSHKSELFWKANIERFGENQYSVIAALRDLLESNDEETVVVACYDLGEFAARSPVGRQKLEEMGAKLAVMKLLQSSSEAIRREALRTTQLMLLRQ